MKAAGYPPDYLWRCTPHQLGAMAKVSVRVGKRDYATSLEIAAVGARGDWEAVMQKIKDMSR